MIPAPVRRSCLAAGFTLIELLVVLVIIATVMGMVMANQGRWTADATVRAAADRFAGVCRAARMRALVEQAPYAITVNIQNQPGSSGRVINNRSGGHWYRLVGPARGTRNAVGTNSQYNGVGRSLLIAYPGSADVPTGSGGGFWTFPELVEALQDTWVGPQYQLPAGKVRFLALGDTDEGARAASTTQASTYGYAPTYPRPWFGYFDPGRRRLFPWGGYDPHLSTTEPWTTLLGANPVTTYTAFFYQGSDPPIVGCVNPVDRAFNVDWNHDGDFSDSDPLRGSEQGYRVFAAAAPRPLVSGDWQDFLIVFRPDGTVYCPPFKTNRRRFSNQQYVPGTSGTGGNALFNANGVCDTTKPWISTWGLTPGLLSLANYKFGGPNGYANERLVDQPEIAHAQRNSGAYRITLAVDSVDDRDAFPDARAALAALGPVYQVEISVQGGIQVCRIAIRDDGALSGHALFPTSPGFWNDAASAAALATSLRWGFLHHPYSRAGSALGSASMPDDTIPRGRLITGFVTPRMLSDRIWWFDE